MGTAFIPLKRFQRPRTRSIGSGGGSNVAASDKRRFRSPRKGKESRSNGSNRFRFDRCLVHLWEPRAVLVVGASSTCSGLVRYPIHGSHQLGCGGVSFTRSHVYSFGFCLSTSSYCRLVSPSVANRFLPVFRYSYLFGFAFSFLCVSIL